MAENPEHGRIAGCLRRAADWLPPLLSLCYPLLWYWGHGRGAFGWLALLMAAVWTLRALRAATVPHRLPAAILAAFFMVAWLWDKPMAMYWYPVGVNLLMLLLFGASLLTRQSLIERLARLREPDLPPAGVRYTRRVTQIWCVFFVLNGSVAAALVLMQAWAAWALYTGVIAYVLMGALLGGEWLYRRYVLRLPLVPGK